MFTITTLLGLLCALITSSLQQIAQTLCLNQAQKAPSTLQQLRWLWVSFLLKTFLLISFFLPLVCIDQKAIPSFIVAYLLCLLAWTRLPWRHTSEPENPPILN
jgi:uncharacterized BrkB/YihY/UPF0761 family membrane protein